MALLPARIAHRYTSGRGAADLPAATRIGPGLAIQHGWGLVVSPGATIGANVTLFHGVTIGQADSIAPDGTRTTRYPVIEDEVWIGPNAVVTGGVRVGRGSRILAGALVTHDVPAHSIVLGNPSEVVKSGCLPDVVNPVDLTLFSYEAPAETPVG
ncbi:serine O-acetyltransferase [Cryptosporangium phraense]|uniref:serine O-acetyltransferase n=1 Tax=Cryptosporangium phraense TaxID=2593070 RepID=UPI00197B01DD|nr:serine acetyltransferase [Cryptosporangium phraense]